MRKMIFTFALAAVAGVASAQVAHVGKINKSMAQQLPTLNQKMEIAKSGAKVPMKTKADGVYYQPQGGLWKGFSLRTGMGYYQSTYSVAPFVDITYKNMSTGSSAWTVNGKDASQNVVDGNLVLSYNSNGTFYGPIVSVGSKSWSYGDNNLLALRNSNSEYAIPLVVTDSVSTLYVVNPLGAYQYKGQYYNNVQAWGALSTDNMYGTGTITYKASETGLDKDYVGVSSSVEQIFPALAAPLYVEEVAVDGFTFTQPIPEGKELTLYITDVVENDKGNKVAGNEILQNLTASAADTLDFKSSATRNNKTVYSGTVLFSKKTTDELGIETNDPFILPANKEFAIVVAGFDQDGVDFGPTARNSETEYDVPDAAFNVYIPDLDQTYRHYYSGCTLNAYLSGMFEGIHVFTSGVFKDDVDGVAYNSLHVSADGKTLNYQGFDTYNGLPIAPATNWYDEYGNENYTFKNIPSWVHYTLDDSALSQYGFYIVDFTCDALPEGTNGRTATFTVEGRGGIESDQTIYIAQGDATNGINGVDIDEKSDVKNAAVYNIAGQKVNNNYKGFIIEGGKKFIKK